MTRGALPIVHTETTELHPSTVLLAHVLADGEAARYARVRVDPAWLGDALWQRAWAAALDSAHLAPDQLLARFDGMDPETWSDSPRGGDRFAWLAWREAWTVPASVLDAYPVDLVAAAARQASRDGWLPPYSAQPARRHAERQAAA